MFTDVREYISYLIRKYSVPYRSDVPTDEEFLRITKSELSKYNISPEDSTNKGLSYSLDNLFNIVLTSLPVEEQNEVKRCIAIGVAELGELNACITKGGKNIYGIIFSSGLMLIIHKLFKILFASVHPEDVIYCNRDKPSKLTSQDYKLMFFEVCENYIATGEPKGPLIKFDEQSQEEYSITLNIAEAFVLSHEIAHFLNGDLDDDDNFIQLGQEETIVKYLEGKHHDREFMADIKAFKMILNLNYPYLPKGATILPIMLMMGILEAIGAKETYSHPSPKNRMVNILNTYYGEGITEQWLKTYPL